RLPLGGERFAGMDARRRAPSLLARVLSGLGRCVRGGTAADVRARPGREDQKSLEGTEGAGGTARGAGVPAGIARPRRAVLGPRPDRPPRHPRRRHPHHRRRRPHGALLVASARRGGAGRRSRDDDQPRHDRAERAAADAQGVARRHDARRDFRRPRRDGLIMRSPAAAIAWEFRRRHRWGLLALLAYLAALAAGMAALWFATRLLAVWPKGVAVPVVWPALLAASLMAWTQALTWMPYPLPGLRVMVTILWLATIDAVVLLALQYKTPEPVMLAILAPHVPLAYLAARFAVARARRAHVPDWPRSRTPRPSTSP